jgi:hypothetical protein
MMTTISHIHYTSPKVLTFRDKLKNNLPGEIRTRVQGWGGSAKVTWLRDAARDGRQSFGGWPE